MEYRSTGLSILEKRTPAPSYGVFNPCISGVKMGLFRIFDEDSGKEDDFLTPLEVSLI